MSERAAALDVAPAHARAAREAASSALLLPLKVRNLCFSAGGTRIIENVNLDISGSGVTVVMGPNGAGKSVLLRLLHGLLRPTSGDILWNGRAPGDDIRRRQAMVFQRPVLLRGSLLANMRFTLDLRHAPSMTEKAREALALAGLEHLAGLPARLLSGGEQQRAAIARALALAPEVLFLDEPVASLDPASTLAVEQLIAAARDRGAKVILVSHDLAHARRVADDIVFLHRGHVSEVTPAKRFFSRPTSPEGEAYVQGRILL